MSFIRAGCLFAASTGVKLAASLVIIKVIALAIGAEGLGRLGQFMSVMTMVTLLAGGGISTGMMKYVSQFRHDGPVLKRYLGAASFIGVAAGAVIALLLTLFAGRISLLLLGTREYAGVIYLLAAVQFLIAGNNYATALINGREDARGFALVTVAGTLAGAGLLLAAIGRGGVRGAMFGLILMPAATALFSIPYACRQHLHTLGDLLPHYNREEVKRLVTYAGMLCVTVVTLPVAQIVIRKLMEREAGWGAVGYWQGTCRISDAYLQFVTVVLANYYLPRLSATTTKEALRREVFRALRLALPVTMAMAAGIYLARDLIIAALFAPGFEPMRDYFLFQLLGDCLKISAYTIGYVGVARAMARLYVMAEIYQALFYVLLAFGLVKLYGPVGITYAYSVTYGIYFAIACWLFRRYLKRDETAADLSLVPDAGATLP